MTLYIFESSAYKYISELGSSAAQSSGRSFMYRDSQDSGLSFCHCVSTSISLPQLLHSNIIIDNQIYYFVSPVLAIFKTIKVHYQANCTRTTQIVHKKNSSFLHLSVFIFNEFPRVLH